MRPGAAGGRADIAFPTTLGIVSNDLPPVAEARMAEIRRSGTWSSAVTADEFASIRSVGFDTVGQVLGAAVYNIGYTGGYGCPGAWNSYGGGYSWGPGARTQVSSAGGYGSIGRMVEECAELGGHGVVGVRLSIGPFPSGGLEFKAIGTAVRAPGAKPLKKPFTSDLSGQDFTKLVMRGWFPAGLVLGISVAARHDDWMTRGQTRWGAGNNEVTGWTELVNEARHDARTQLGADVKRAGAEGVVVAGMEMHVRERECPAQEGGRDHIIEAVNIGTAIVRFSSQTERSGAAPLAIMSLDPQRRQAARVDIGANRK
jgi:uncharacterized protein YbjQ (UPF0145 family)